MIEKTYEEKLAIAKQGYKQIKAAIDAFESDGDGNYVHWDGFLSVEGHAFHEHQLKDETLNRKEASQ